MKPPRATHTAGCGEVGLNEMLQVGRIKFDNAKRVFTIAVYHNHVNTEKIRRLILEKIYLF